MTSIVWLRISSRVLPIFICIHISREFTTVKKLILRVLAICARIFLKTFSHITIWDLSGHFVSLFASAQVKSVVLRTWPRNISKSWITLCPRTHIRTIWRTLILLHHLIVVDVFSLFWKYEARLWWNISNFKAFWLLTSIHSILIALSLLSWLLSFLLP